MTYILLLFQQLISSTTHIVGKSITTQVDPALVLLFRAGIASSIFLIVMLLFKERRRKIEKKDIWVFLLLGLINIPINQFLFLQAVKLTSPSNVALAYALTPAFVLIIAVLFLKERPKLINSIGIFVAIAGTVLVLAEKGFNFRSSQFLGDILGLLASISWAFYTILGKNITRKYGAIFSTTIAMVTGLILYIPVFLLVPVKCSKELHYT
jgi:drug/metabolite transporter (DMT)-like permease